MIDSQTKQRIIDAANILEVVQDFVSLRRSGVVRTSVSVSLVERVAHPFILL